MLEPAVAHFTTLVHASKFERGLGAAGVASAPLPMSHCPRALPTPPPSSPCLSLPPSFVPLPLSLAGNLLTPRAAASALHSRSSSMPPTTHTGRTCGSWRRLSTSPLDIALPPCDAAPRPAWRLRAPSATEERRPLPCRGTDVSGRGGRRDLQRGWRYRRCQQRLRLLSTATAPGLKLGTIDGVIDVLPAHVQSLANSPERDGGVGWLALGQ